MALGLWQFLVTICTSTEIDLFLIMIDPWASHGPLEFYAVFVWKVDT